MAASVKGKTFERGFGHGSAVRWLELGKIVNLGKIDGPWDPLVLVVCEEVFG